ncbi:MAG: hypothetical protein V3U76_01785 [Granulosicoccus sp.]
MISMFAILTGIGLLLINIYGELRGFRAAELVPTSTLRFNDDISIGYDEAMDLLERRDDEDSYSYTTRVNTVVQDAMAHIHNWESHPPDLYMQRVPFYENYFLHLLGRFSDQPYIRRYHFADYRKSLERGIGICGDHAVVMSQLVAQTGTKSSLLAFPAGHVLLATHEPDGKFGIFDADFGVNFMVDDLDMLKDQDVIAKAYSAQGYPDDEVAEMVGILGTSYDEYSDTYDFMKRRYIFEKVSYVMKWLMPVTFVLFGLYLLRAQRSVAAKVLVSRSSLRARART